MSSTRPRAAKLRPRLSLDRWHPVYIFVGNRFIFDESLESVRRRWLIASRCQSPLDLDLFVYTLVEFFSAKGNEIFIRKSFQVAREGSTLTTFEIKERSRQQFFSIHRGIHIYVSNNLEINETSKIHRRAWPAALKNSTLRREASSADT